MADINALETALESALSGAPLPEKEAPVAEAAPEEEAPILTPEEAAGGEPVAEAAPPAEPELEIEVEVDGKHERIAGTEHIKELVQKGVHYSKNSEAVAREREALAAAQQQQQLAGAVHQVLQGDFATLKAMDQQLEEWNKIDLATLFETNTAQALQLKERRDQLREARAAKFNECQQKVGQASAALQRARNDYLVAEESALLAKLPEWRNSEKAQTEAGSIKAYVVSKGFTKAEADNMGDHRLMILAREAYLYRQMMNGKDAKLKQVRTAPGVARPGATPAAADQRTEWTKVKGKIKEFGTKGNHKAQEDMATRLFERAFK